MGRKNRMTSLTTTKVYIPISNPPWRPSQKVLFSTWTLTNTEDHMAPWAIPYTGSWYATTYFWMLCLSTIRWMCILRPRELEFLLSTSKQNGHNVRKILRCFQSTSDRRLHLESRLSVASVPFVGPDFSHISRMLFKHNIKTAGLPPTKVASFLWPSRMTLAWKNWANTPPVRVQWSTVDKPGVPFKTGIQEYHRHIRLYHPEKSSLAEHSTNLSPRPGPRY
jgi:hypothetical protein